VSLLTLANRKPPVDKAVQRWTVLAVHALVTADAKKGQAPDTRSVLVSRLPAATIGRQGVEWVRVPP
jgi:hypothetical protein